MTEAEPVSAPHERAQRRVFISYATADQKQALSACGAIEKRGISCWLATRDVAPGENYQEAIVDAIRCEHHQYGWMLLNVGRVNDSLQQLRQASDMLALYVYTSLNLADALVAVGKFDEAREQFETSVDLAPNADFAEAIKITEAMQTGDAALLADARLPIDPGLRTALLGGWRAARSGDSAAKARAAQTLASLPEEQRDVAVALLLGELGASRQAFDVAARLAERDYPGPSLFWYRSMRGTLSDPRFPALAAKLGLIGYWKASGTRPDVCYERAPPRFCSAIQ